MATTAQSGGFAFNLLPPKPKEEVELEVEREDSITYAFVLIFVAAIIYFGLVLVGAVVIEPRLQTAVTAVTNRTNQIQAFSSVQTLHGELFVKTNTLKPVLSLDINPSEIFRVAEALVDGDSNLQVTNYARERTGTFVFQVLSPSFEDVINLADKASKIDGVSGVFIRTSQLNPTQTGVITTIALNIDALGTGTQN